MMIYPAESGTKQHSIELQVSIILSIVHINVTIKEGLKDGQKPDKLIK